MAVLFVAGGAPLAAAQSKKDIFDGSAPAVAPERHIGSIRQIAVDADGRFAVMAADDRVVRIWSLETGKQETPIFVPMGNGASDRLYTVAISPDGTLIAAGGRAAGEKIEQFIYLFDRHGRRLVKRFSSLPTATFHLLFSPDGRHLAAAFGGEAGLRVYGRDAKWGEILRVPADRDDAEIRAAAFSRDGRLVTANGDGAIQLYDRSFVQKAAQETHKGREPSSIAFSPDGTKLVIGFTDSAGLEVRDGQTLAPLPAPDTSVITGGNLPRTAWSMDGRVILAGGRLRREDPDTAGVWGWSGAESSKQQTILAGKSDLKTLIPLSDGGILVADAEGYLARLGADGRVRWDHHFHKADFRGQHGAVAVSHDGMTVAFGFGAGGQDQARFHMAGLTWLPPGDAPAVSGLPSIGSDPMPAQVRKAVNRYLSRFEKDADPVAVSWRHGFIVGTEWALRRHDPTGRQVWKQAAPGPVLAVTVSGDQRMAVAAYGDGSIRWHRMDDGGELLAFMPLGSRAVWVAWTPQGFYAASAEARKILQKPVSQVRGMVAEGVPVADFPNLYQPDAIKLVLQEGETPRALGLATMKAARDAIRQRSSAARDATLHVLTVGINEYGEQAQRLRLRFAEQDARDIGAALDGEQGAPYRSIRSFFLSNEMAGRRGILDTLYLIEEGMTGGSDQNLAVLMFSAHGAMRGGTYYLLPYGVDILSRSAFSGTALSLPELQTHVRALAKKGRVLLLLDTCHSGAAGEASDANTLITGLAETNITVITSSSSAEKSYETEAWGHGAFTLALLEAFAGKADTNRNGMIGVGELVSYLRGRVGALTNGAQTVGVKTMFEGDLFAAGL
ncbi:WD40 repeat protein [Azospirillum fermentarium]|uniref:hypothetical protein n=1 Tax=Azospirillum fermentarium TaxID=1233114 RepID=UPI002225D933|nr:hypothetical protein [Azospirillum fermentarium]MCW2247617.1 WD40 repeat protein [Azospirillum fermentarium]